MTFRVCFSTECQNERTGHAVTCYFYVDFDSQAEWDAWQEKDPSQEYLIDYANYALPGHVICETEDCLIVSIGDDVKPIGRKVSLTD
jgi:hypothetical protein